jgi:hypothetical protein
MLLKTMVGDDDFKNLLFNSDVFVDKSLFIKEFIEGSGYVTLIARPRRFGKSLNMNMLKRFLEIEIDEQGNRLPLEQRVNHKLFLGGEVDLGLASGKKKILNPLKIAKHTDLIEDRLGQFPVILLSFKNMKGNSYQEILDKVKLNIRNLFKDYTYLLHSKKISDLEKGDFQYYLNSDIDLAHLENSLLFLSTLLCKHFSQKVYILIDEYDAPINSSYLKFGDRVGEFELVLDIFRAIFGSGLKSNISVVRGLITGILRIAKANLFSDLNNPTEDTLLDKRFSKFYGFTQEEVDELLTKTLIPAKAEDIKNWYNGYIFGGEVIYNPWSIMQCLSNEGVLDSYWIDSGDMGLLKRAFLDDGMQQNLQALLKGNSVTVPIVKQISFDDIDKPVGFYSLLLFAGYLSPEIVDAAKNFYSLSVPNKEISRIYELRLIDWVVDKLKSDTVEYYSLISVLAEGRVEEFRDKLQEILLNATSFYQTGDKKAELFYSGFMLGLINNISTTHILDSERESGSGRFDIALIPKQDKSNLAIIIEYKTSKNPDSLKSEAIDALKQVQEKKYDTKIKELDHIKQILKIGMAFCGKEVAMEYQIDMI